MKKLDGGPVVGLDLLLLVVEDGVAADLSLHEELVLG